MMLMLKRITIQPRMRFKELEQLARQYLEVVESPHYQRIWPLAQGKKMARSDGDNRLQSGVDSSFGTTLQSTRSICTVQSPI
jgi:hypothetical protein